MSERTNSDIRKLAMGAMTGTVFTSNHISPQSADLLPRVFMPLSLMTEKARKELDEKEPALFFEHINNALPWALNGYPIFGTFQWLSQSEFETFSEYIEELTAFQNEDE